MTVDGLEKERDFYFGKLRDIELICQENEADTNPVMKSIMDILYATEVSARIAYLLCRIRHLMIVNNMDILYATEVSPHIGYLLCRIRQTVVISFRIAFTRFRLCNDYSVLPRHRVIHQ